MVVIASLAFAFLSPPSVVLDRLGALQGVVGALHPAASS